MGSNNMTLRLMILLGILLTFCFGDVYNQQATDRISDECEYPDSCTNCFEDIGNVISLCFDHPDPPVCLGSIIMTTSDCPPCLCDILATQIAPDLVHYLCPFCPHLQECN